LNSANATRWDDGNANNYSKCLVDTGSSNLAVASPTCCITEGSNGQCDYYFPSQYCYDENDPYAVQTGSVSMK
jgi:hypothetical protein